MADWFNNPVFVLGLIAALVAAGKWIGATDKSVKALDGFVKEIREIFMPEIRDDIKKIFAKVGEPLTVAESPVRLTKLGEDIAKALGAREWAAQVAETMEAGLQGKRPFEIDREAAQRANAVVEEPAWRDKIAETAYQHGLKAEELTATLHIPLRDELLRRTGNTPEDLDAPEEETG